MTTDNKHKQPWLTIGIGLIILVVTTLYYSAITKQTVIYYSTIGIFEMYSWAVIITGSFLTVWAYFKLRTLSKMWLLLLVLAANLATLYFFQDLLKPLPSQFRFSLTNKTNTDLTDLRVIGDEELRLDDLKKNTTLNFIVHDYSENTDIDLICKLGNKTDTLNLAESRTNSCGYYYDLDITLKDRQLYKQ